MLYTVMFFLAPFIILFIIASISAIIHLGFKTYILWTFYGITILISQGIIFLIVLAIGFGSLLVFFWGLCKIFNLLFSLF